MAKLAIETTQMSVVFCVFRFQKSRQICHFHWRSKS